MPRGQDKQKEGYESSQKKACYYIMPSSQGQYSIPKPPTPQFSKLGDERFKRRAALVILSEINPHSRYYFIPTEDYHGVPQGISEL